MELVPIINGYFQDFNLFKQSLRLSFLNKNGTVSEILRKATEKDISIF